MTHPKGSESVCRTGRGRDDPRTVLRTGEPIHENLLQVAGGGTLPEHVSLALEALRRTEQCLASSRLDAATAYANMKYLEMLARSRLGCGATSDGECMTNTASAISASNDSDLKSQWHALELAETLRETATGSLLREAGKLRTTLAGDGDASSSGRVDVIRRASLGVALAAEVDGLMIRDWSSNINIYMGETHVGFRGTLSSITDPGRRAALLLATAVDDLEQAEAEINLVAASVSLPSGHVLINTPNR